MHRVKLVSLSVDLDQIKTSSGDYMMKAALAHWCAGTEKGRWCEEHCTNLEIFKEPDYSMFMYRIAVVGEMLDKDLTYYLLKWENDKDNDAIFFINTL